MEHPQKKSTSNGTSFFRRGGRAASTSSTWSSDANQGKTPWRDWLRRGKGANNGQWVPCQPLVVLRRGCTRIMGWRSQVQLPLHAWLAEATKTLVIQRSRWGQRLVEGALNRPRFTERALWKSQLWFKNHFRQNYMKGFTWDCKYCALFCKKCECLYDWDFIW